MSSRSASSASSRSEPSRPSSTSPRVPRKAGGGGGETRSKAGLTPTSKPGETGGRTLPRTSASTGQLESGKKESPGTTRKISHTGGARPSARDGTKTSPVKSAVGEATRLKNSRSPTGEETRRKTSVVDKKSSPLAQRKATVSQSPSKKTGSAGEPKSPTGSGSTTAVRGGSKLPRPSGTPTDKTQTKDKKLSPNSTRKVASGKPPSGAHSATSGARSTNKQPAGATGRKTPTKAGGLSNGTTDAEKGGAEVSGERVRKSSASSSGSVGGRKTGMVGGVKRPGLSGGRDSPANRDRKTGGEKKPKSADNSPATLRRAGSVRRPPGSISPATARKSSTLRRIGSSGSIPVSQRPVREKKADSISPKIERRTSNEKKAGSASPKTDKRTGTAKNETRGGEKKTGKTISPGTTRRSVAESGRRGTGEGGSVRKQTSSAGINPLGRRSLRSHSEINIGAGALRKNDTQSLGRKISATSGAGRGSPSPSTLAGKTVILDHTDLRNEERLRSTLKLLGGKGGAPGVKKANRGQVIKSMGVASTSSGRSTPTASWKNPHSGVAGKSGITRTGSGTSIPTRTSAGSTAATKTGVKSNPNSRTRLRSADDVLKDNRNSPAETADKVRVTSPLSMATVAPTHNNEVKKEEEKEVSETIEQENQENLENSSDKSQHETSEETVAEDAPAEKIEEKSEKEDKLAVEPEKAAEVLAPPTGLSGELKKTHGRGLTPSRPSCRNTQVKSKIASWKKKEEEARGTSLSPVPPSPRSPSSFSHVSPTSKISPQLTPDPAGPLSPPASPGANLTPRRSSEPLSTRGRHRQRSESPTPNLPVKSRIAMWAEKEREAREIRSSLSPQRSPTRSPTTSPQGSPKSSPKGLRRQSPVDKNRRSPARSLGNSREGSVESNARSLEASPSRQLPSITIKDEKLGKNGEKSLVPQTTDDVYEDVEVSPSHRPLPEIPVSQLVQEAAVEAPVALTEEAIYSTIPDVFQEDTPPQMNHINERVGPGFSPHDRTMKTKQVEGDMKVVDVEDEDESGKASDAQYTKPAPAYTEIDILEDPKISGVIAQSVGPELTPKSKRRWLRSPRFGRRKGSTDDAHSEGAASDREEKKEKSEGFMKRIGRLGSRSGKDKFAVKRRSGEIPAIESDTSSSPEHALAVAASAASRARSSSELTSDQLTPEVIPRSNSYSPAASPEVGYSLTSHKNLDPTSQRVVTSNPTLSNSSAAVYGSATEKKLDPVSQKVVSNPALDQSASAGRSSTSSHLRPSGSGGSPLSHELRSLIDNFGEGGFCDEYSKKMSSLSGNDVVEKGPGSAPGGLRLPVRFELTSPNHGSSHPNLVSVGFKLPSNSSGATVPNGVGVRGHEEMKEGSDSSTASEGEEPGSSEKEEEGDSVYPIESSLDKGRYTR